MKIELLPKSSQLETNQTRSHKHIQNAKARDISLNRDYASKYSVQEKGPTNNVECICGLSWKKKKKKKHLEQRKLQQLWNSNLNDCMTPINLLHFFQTEKSQILHVHLQKHQKNQNESHFMYINIAHSPHCRDRKISEASKRNRHRD